MAASGQFLGSHEELSRILLAAGEKIDKFVRKHQLPSEWFMRPDYIAFKATDTSDYRGMMARSRTLSTRQTECSQGGRLLGTTELKRPVILGDFGEIEWVEIMEPRPEKVGVDPTGLDHVEFYFKDFEQVRRLLGLRAITYEDQCNESHAWVSFHAGALEIKLNNGTLADVVDAELADGRATVSWIIND